MGGDGSCLFGLNMMPKQITFHQLKQALEKLGFEETSVNESYIKFNNPQAGAILVFSGQQRNRALHPAYRRMVERVLEETGILGREGFENLFHSFSIADMEK